MRKFKIGDRVRRVSERNECRGYTVEPGMTGTVTGYNAVGNVRVQWDLFPRTGATEEGNNEEYLQLEREPEHHKWNTVYMSPPVSRPSEEAAKAQERDKRLMEHYARYVQATVLPTDAAERKAIPVATGCLDYFPAALAEVAKISQKGNDQHNPGEPLHHARGKSTDHADTIIRHFMERGTMDTDGVRHSAKVAWRALALLQEEMEEQTGAPLPRGARKADPAGNLGGQEQEVKSRF